MTREEAEAHAAKLAAEHPERESCRFVPREGADGKWSVVKIGLAPAKGPTGADVVAAEKPPTPDNPGSVISRNVFGPYGAA